MYYFFERRYYFIKIILNGQLSLLLCSENTLPQITLSKFKTEAFPSVADPFPSIQP
jgi:hypothetical protein